MATFHVQVEGLTGLSIDGSSTPTEDELTEFLKDGVHDVTSKCIAAKPGDIDLFGRESSISDSQGVSVGGGRVLHVMREGNIDGSSDGTTSWYPCKKISASLQSRVVDSTSLHYASIYNPVYTINSDKTINVYPVPSANNGIKVFYVNEEPRDITNNTSLTHAHSDIKYFPNSKVYLVVLYAAIKCLEHKMATYTHTSEDTELTQAIAGNIAAMKASYAGAFGGGAAQRQPQQQGARR